MGLIKAVVGSVSGTLADQYKEYFMCDSMSSDVLVARGFKRTAKKSSNKGSDSIITNGSVISVGEGQCMLIVQNGEIIEMSAEPGSFVFDSSTEGTIFEGELKQSIKETFDTIKKRITFAGDVANEQRVYYINIKEIFDNKFGTPNPVPFRIVDNNIGLDVDVSIRCNGAFTFKIEDPLLFFTNVAGNVTNIFSKDVIEAQLRTEFLNVLQPAFAKISEMGIRYSALPGHTVELSETINDLLSAKWRQSRGIVITTIGINSITAPKEDEDMIKELQKTAVMKNSSMAAATLVNAQAQAMQDAAKNTATGPMMAFANMNMASNAGGVNVQDLFEMGQSNPEPQNSRPVQNGWTCSCGAHNTGKFCTECGKPQIVEWTCVCGTKNTGKFCMECGKPAQIKTICPTCGFQIEGKVPKFCPECGTPLGK